MRLSYFLMAASAWPMLACSARPSAAGPGIVVPVALADGSEKKGQPDAGAAAKTQARATTPAAKDSASSGQEPASATPATAAAPAASAPPDPEPLRTADQIEYTVTYENGAARIEAVRRLKLEKPVVTARKMGRFAIELWVGRELIDRVRFDFPLLAAEESPSERQRLKSPPPLTRGPIRATLLVPFSERARRAVLLDRATNQETELTWPPIATPAPAR
jgi:hypothetical protein